MGWRLMGVGWKLVGVLVGAVLALAPQTVVATATGAAAAETLTVVAIADVDQIRTDDGRGGLDRIAHVIRSERARGGEVLVIHAGDALSPSILSAFDKGAHIVDVLNRMTIDVFVPGNHEFDFGPEVFLERMAALKATKLAANIRTADGAPLPGFSDTVTRTVGAVTVGILGVTNDRTPTVSSSGDLVFLPAVPTALETAKTLRAEGADIVVAVAHVGVAEDDALMRSGLVDLVVSGDDHALRVEYDGRTVLLQSREQGDQVPVADLSFVLSGEGDRRQVTMAPSFRVIDTAAVEPEATLEPVIAGHLASLDAALGQEIAVVAAPLDTRRPAVRRAEAGFGNLVADAMLAATGADFALMNGGGIRADRLYPTGTRLTRRDVFAELPFGNTVVVVELKGTDLVAALENGVSQLEGAGRFPQIAGGSIEVAAERPVGQRLVSLTVGGAPVDPDATYRVATNSFLLAGGDGYRSLANGTVIVPATDGALLANVVADHIAALGEVSAEPEGRIVFLSR